MEETKRMNMEEPGDVRLWFGALGGPIAWAIHLVLLYPLVPFVCQAGGSILLYIVAFVLIGVIVFAGITAWLSWKKIPVEDQRRLLDDMNTDRRTFMSFFGLLSSGFFLFAAILGTLPIFFMHPCLVAGQHT
jgi:hypothetical protein